MEEPDDVAREQLDLAVMSKLLALELLVSNAWIRIARDEAERRRIEVGAVAEELSRQFDSAVVDEAMPEPLKGMVRGQIADIMRRLVDIAELLDGQQRLKPR